MPHRKAYDEMSCVRQGPDTAYAALKHGASGEYVGEHWLALFAVCLLGKPVPE